MHWDHGSDLESLVPIAMSELRKQKTRSAMNTVGRLLSFKVLPGGRKAQVIYRTSDSKATEKVAAGDVFVSPVILPRWKDGSGNHYRDLITHLDLVNHPVDHSQGPAIRIDDAMAMSAIRLGNNKPFRLNLETAVDGFEDDDVDKLLNGDDAELGDIDGDIGNESDPTPSGDGLDELPDFSEGMTDGPEADTGDFGPEISDVPDGPGVGDVILALADHGVVLPDDTTDANFMDRLRTALIAKKGAAPEGGDMETDFNEEDTIIADPQIATMSAYANNQYRKQLNAQLGKLLKTGRCSPAEYRAKRESLTAVRLSLVGGKPKESRVTDWIDSRAALPAGAVWQPDEKLRKLSLHSPEPRKQTSLDRSQDGVSAAEADRIAKELVG